MMCLWLVLHIIHLQLNSTEIHWVTFISEKGDSRDTLRSRPPIVGRSEPFAELRGLVESLLIKAGTGNCVDERDDGRLLSVRIQFTWINVG